MMQTQLNKKGFRLSVDGIAGPQTIGALKKFQKSKGLVVDGLCGKNTWGKLYAT
jgi:N-acetylmuramoyl-L-alanine amidase